jgi:ribosomal protein S18 acetylase RimI-like enzyme
MISTQLIPVDEQDATIAIHPAAAEDEWAVRALFGALHAGNAALEPRFALAAGWPRLLADRLTRERATGSGLTFLAWAGVEPVGLAMVVGNLGEPMFRHSGWAELTALYVAPTLRRAGVAGRLLAAAQGWARAKDFAEVRLYVTASNSRARRFYAAAGMRPIQEIWITDVNA